MFRPAVNDRPDRCSIVDLLPVLSQILRDLASNQVTIQKYSTAEILSKMGPSPTNGQKLMLPVQNDTYDVDSDFRNEPDSYEIETSRCQGSTVELQYVSSV